MIIMRITIDNACFKVSITVLSAPRCWIEQVSHDDHLGQGSLACHERSNNQSENTETIIHTWHAIEMENISLIRDMERHQRHSSIMVDPLHHSYR